MSSGLLFQRVFSSAVLVILVSVSAFSLRAAEPVDVSGTMPEDYLPELKTILTQALQRSPDTIAREFDRLSQEARVTQVKAAQLPRFGGNFNYGSTQSATASNTSSQSRNSGFFYNFGLSQALFHWGALKNQTAAARINLLVAEKSYALAYRELSVTLRKAYLSLIAEKARVRQARRAVGLVEADVKVAETKKADGSVSGAFVATEQLRLREARVQLARTEAEFEANRRRFARLAGLKEFKEDAIPDSIPRPGFPEKRAAVMTATLLRDNAQSTLEFGIYDLRVREAMLRQKIEAVRLLPKFGLNVGYSLTNTTNVFGEVAEQRAVTEQTIGVGGSWDIFDGFATRGAKREAAVARRASEHRKAIEIEQLLQNVQALERTLRVDAEQVELAEIWHGNALEGHRLVKEEVEFGKMPKAEIGRAQINVLQNEARSLEARAVFLGRWSEFVALAGEDPVLNNLPARNGEK